MFILPKRLLSMLSGALALLLLAACGGGAGGGADLGGVNNPAAKTGTVTIGVGDGLIHEYDQVVMEIAEIRFLSDGGQDILVLDEPATIDFLALQNFSEVLLRREVVTGTYSKIRLILNRLTLVKLNPDGSVASEDDVPLNGLQKVDINPRGSFTVRGGQELLIEIEIDLDKSIHVVGAGNSGRIQFRPVIFASIEPADAFDKLFRLQGRVDSINTTGGTFRVCDIRRAFMDGINRPEPKDVCIVVDPDSDTPFFDMEANPVAGGFDDLAVNDPVVVYGKFDAFASEDRLVPAVVAIGAAFDRPMGVASAEYRPDTADFDLGVATEFCAIDPAPYRIVVAPGAPAFIETATGADAVDLATLPLLCLRTEVEGYADTVADPFLRAFIVLLGEPVAGRLELVGTLTEIVVPPGNDNDYELDLAGSDETEVVEVSDSTRLVKITFGAGGQVVSTEELTDVPVGEEVTVFGLRRTDGSDIVDATFILQEVTGP